MKHDFVRLAVFLSLFIVVVFAVFVVNQTAQAVQLARDLHPKFGVGLLWGLVSLYAVLVLTPVVLFLRLPRQLKPLRSKTDPRFQSYLSMLQRRLARNPRLAGYPLRTEGEVQAAIGKLDEQTSALVQRAASTVFLSTALMQSGRLDALIVLAVQSRLVWQVAHVYAQRPAMGDLVRLYGNVAVTAFLAAGVEEALDDVDLEQLAGSLFSTTAGSIFAVVPGAQLVAASLLSGATNAFLTLRVGMIAKRYCNCLVLEDRSVIRRTATAEAIRLLGVVVKDGTVKISAALWTTSTSKAKEWTQSLRWPWSARPEEA